MHLENHVACAHEAREALIAAGFIPMFADETLGEYWTKNERYCILWYAGSHPEDVPLDKSVYVSFARLDSGELLAIA